MNLYCIKNNKIYSYIHNILAKCENVVKAMSFKAAIINCLKELVEFSVLIAQYLKFSYVI